MKNRFILVFMCLAFIVTAQVPTQINYQGVARSTNGTPIANTTITVRLTIHENTATGNPIYSETRTVTTNSLGLYTVIMGSSDASSISGAINNINWANNPKYLEVEIDPAGGNSLVSIGTSQLNSVPFALHAQKADQISSTATISSQQITSSYATTGQVLVWNGTNWLPTTLPTGTTFTAGAGIAISGNTISANDASSTNEIQTISKTGNTISLSNGGGSVTVTDADAQTLTLNGSNLSISNGNTIALPTGTTYTAGSGIAINGNTISANDVSATNEIQTISKTGNTISLSNGGGSVTVTDAQSLSLSGSNLSISNGNTIALPTGTTYTAGSGIAINGNTISANDISSTNEIQTLSRNGRVLSLSNGGGNITLPDTITKGTALGDMLYWNGTAWTRIPIGINGQYLTICNGLPTWNGCTATLPLVQTLSTSGITTTTANSGGNVSNDGGASILSKGVVWSTSPLPTISLSTKTINGTGTGLFNSTITGLIANTTYYLRAYATNSVGTAYGAQITFTTLSSVLPTIQLSYVVNETRRPKDGVAFSAILSDGGSTIINRGICWSTNPNPTINLATKIVETSSDIGNFSIIIDDALSFNTTYYFRTFATNSVGTAYSNQYTVTTVSNGYAPIVQLLDSSGINADNIILLKGIFVDSSEYGGINYTGGLSNTGFPITAAGFCWSTSINPTLSNNFINVLSAPENVELSYFYANNLQGFIPNTIYYIRAYATNAVGTSYSSQTFLIQTKPIAVGNKYKGGVIAYILNVGDPGYNPTVPHGYIAGPPNAFPTNVGTWGCSGFVVPGADGVVLGSGQINTNDIINFCPNRIAATIANDYSESGYSDWYLPSKDELDKINPSALGDTASWFYSKIWSSTEISATESWGIDLNSNPISIPKTENQLVIPFRNF
jgi:hypothetical protein